MGHFLIILNEIPDIRHQHKHPLIHHCSECHQSLSLYGDNKSVHRVAYNLARKDLEPLYRAPNCIVHSRIVDDRNSSIVAVENQLHHPDNPIRSEMGFFFLINIWWLEK